MVRQGDRIGIFHILYFNVCTHHQGTSCIEVASNLVFCLLLIFGGTYFSLNVELSVTLIYIFGYQAPHSFTVLHVFVCLFRDDILLVKFSLVYPF